MTAVEKLPVSAFFSSDLLDPIAAANAADECCERKLRDERAKRLRGQRASRQFS